MCFNTFLSDVIATVVGGIILALLFFLIKEKVFPAPNIVGQWHLEVRIFTTAYRPFQDMVLRFVAMLWCEGRVVHGTIEKIYENSSAGEHSYVGAARTRGVVDGYLEKNYLKADRLLLHIVEQGAVRESTSFYELVINSNNDMSGQFTSTAAGQAGTAKWQRKSF